MNTPLDRNRFEEFIARYPVYEYRMLDPKKLKTEERVRIICKQECERTAPPGPALRRWVPWKNVPDGSTVMTTQCFFSSVAEVSDVLNMEEMLATGGPMRISPGRSPHSLRKKASRPIRFPRNPAISASAVPIRKGSPAVIRRGCIPVWRATA